jgi:hypothetical protein
MEEFKKARIQLEKEIREAVVFLRSNNNTIPSETIEFIKIAALEKLKRGSENSSNESAALPLRVNYWRTLPTNAGTRHKKIK